MGGGTGIDLEDEVHNAYLLSPKYVFPAQVTVSGIGFLETIMYASQGSVGQALLWGVVGCVYAINAAGIYKNSK